MKRARPIFTLLAAALIIVPAVLAQSRTELRGTVTDEAGAVVPRVKLILDDGSGRQQSTEADELGRYRFPAVAPGNYTISANAPGFAPFSRAIEIGAGGAHRLDLTLSVVIAEQIEVKPDDISISLEPDRNLSALSLKAEDLTALPDDREEMLEVLRSLAGPGLDAPLYVDGFEETKLPPKNSIQAVRINSNPFSAAFAGRGRNRIEVITRPGSERTRGSVRFDFNDESLNARNAAALFRAPLQIREFSAEIGGPIIAKRWDYYLEVEIEEQDENDVVNATILDPLTLAARPFSTVVVTPAREREINFRTNYLIGERQTIGFRYSREREESRNQGLGSGFDLPERAFNTTASDEDYRFSLTSIISTRALNEIRISGDREEARVEALSEDPALVVLDAFSAGGNQGSRRSVERGSEIEFEDQFSYTRGSHALKAGGEIEFNRWKQANFAGFGGTFTFAGDFERDASGAIITGPDGATTPISSLEHYRRTLAGTPGYRPSQFSIVRGDPELDFQRVEASWFIQDDWRVSPRLMLSFGLRHQLQSDLDDATNLAPRFALAWSPGGSDKGVVRAGAGLFFDDINRGLTIETRRLDGVRQRQLIIRQPSFFPQIPPDLGAAEELQSTIRVRDAGLDAPYVLRTSAGYEREIKGGLVLSATYNYERGTRLLRTRNLNAPRPDGSGRPQPDRGAILQYESTGRSERHELQVSWRYRYKRQINLFGGYTLAGARSDTDGAGSAPADSYDLASEWGRASTDQRHTFTLGGALTLPGEWRFSPFIRASTGRPLNITTGRDLNGDLLFVDRPAFASPGDVDAIVTRFGVFNPNPRPGDEIIPRNFARAPGMINVNLNVTKSFSFGPTRGGGRQGRNNDEQRYRLTLGAHFRNLFNHTNPSGVSGVLSSPRFGTANRALAARRVALSLRFNF